MNRTSVRMYCVVISRKMNYPQYLGEVVLYMLPLHTEMDVGCSSDLCNPSLLS